jgi:hypothetical protein
MLRRYLEDGIDAELVKIRCGAERALIVSLVDRQQQRFARRAQLLRNPLVAADETLASIDDEHNQIGADNRTLALFHDKFVQRVLARAVQAPCVKELKRRSLPTDRTRERIARCTGDGRDDRPTRAGNTVE